MSYNTYSENELEHARKEAIIKKLRDEVDEMKVKYCLKEKTANQDQTSLSRGLASEANDPYSSKENNFNYNSLSGGSSDDFHKKYKVIDYNQFNSEEYNSDAGQPIQGQGDDIEQEEEPCREERFVSRTGKQTKSYYNTYADEKLHSQENEPSTINRYNFTKPVIENSTRKVTNPNENNVYSKRDLYSEYKKEMDQLIPQSKSKIKENKTVPKGGNNQMKRAKSAKTIPMKKTAAADPNKEHQTSKNVTGKDKQVNNDYFNKMKNKYIPKYNKHEEKFEKLKSEIEEKFQKECSFNPRINKDFYTNKERYENKEEVFKRLSTPKIFEIQKRQKENEAEELKRMSEVCTFKPNIGEAIPNKNKFNTVGEVLPEESQFDKETVQDRLLRYANENKEKKERLKQETQETLAKQYSFNPEINENSKQLVLKYGSIPLHERYQEIMKNRQENLQRLRVNMDKTNQNTTYRPEINPKSQEIASMKVENQNPYERLYSDALNKQSNKGVEQPNSVLDECTFTPQLYYSTLQPSGNINDFLERQKVYEEIKKDKVERKMSRSTLENNDIYTFKPKINQTSDILMRADVERANETSKEKVERLSKKNFEKVQKKKEQLEAMHYAQFDFKPKINDISRVVGRDPNLKDISYYRESSKIKEVRDNKLRDEEDLCTFKPNINRDSKYYENVKSNYKKDEKLAEKIKAELKSKQEKIEEKKTLVQNSLQQECKFRPEINGSPKFDFKEPIMLKGFARHLEQMEKARKAKRDKEEREKKVFVSGENWSRDNLITVPKPFNLSYQTVDVSKKQEELLRKKQEVELKDCTFKPNTNEKKNREMIKMILNN